MQCKIETIFKMKFECVLSTLKVQCFLIMHHTIHKHFIAYFEKLYKVKQYQHFQNKSILSNSGSIRCEKAPLLMLKTSFMNEKG